MQKLRGLVISLSFAAVLPACDRHPAPLAAPARDFLVKGVIKELEADGKTAVIRHEAISNYMPAMTMPFEAKDTNVLRGLQPGDEIQFHLVVTPERGWIDNVALLRSNTADTAAVPAGFHLLPALPPLDEGDELPDYHFTNELGQTVSLSQYKGGVLALTFFFTSCPYPDFCPRMTGNFAQAEKLLEAQTNFSVPWRLLSISFDPTNDTPSRLQSYGLTAHYDPLHWSFLTGEPRQIEELADQLGEQFWRDGPGLSHNLRTVVADPRGRIRKIFAGNKWTVAQLVEQMRQAGQSAKEKKQ